MEKVEGWVFTYNTYDKKWMTVKRDDYNMLFNDIYNKAVLRSGSVQTLCEIIIKTNGQTDKL